MWNTKRANLIGEAQRIVDEAKSAGRDITSGERARLDQITVDVKAGDEHAKKAARDARLFEALDGMGRRSGGDGGTNRLAVWPSASRAVAGRLAAKSADLADAVNPTFMDRKSLLPAGGSVADSVMVPPGLVEMPQVPTSFVELLPTTAVESPNYAYLRQIQRENAARPVAPGELKPTSKYGLERVEDSLKVVAHVTEPVGKYDLLDVEALGRFLDAELRFGLFTGLEAQLIGGDGKAPNMRGLLNTSGVQTRAFETDLLTTLRKAVTALENVGYVPSVVVLRPEDWEKLELSKASGSGEFTFASSPIERTARRVWGVQVAVSNQLPVGKAVMMDTTTLGVYTDQAGISVEWATSGDDFERNQSRARCEGRFGLAVYQPNGSVVVSTV